MSTVLCDIYHSLFVLYKVVYCHLAGFVAVDYFWYSLGKVRLSGAYRKP